MGRIVKLAVLSSCLASFGCGAKPDGPRLPTVEASHIPDPASVRLPPGQTVMAFNNNPNDTQIVFKSHTAMAEGLFKDEGIALIPVGAKLRVVQDAQPMEDVLPDRRDVTIYVLEGQHSGLTGTVHRNAVRPIQ